MTPDQAKEHLLEVAAGGIVTRTRKYVEIQLDAGTWDALQDWKRQGAAIAAASENAPTQWRPMETAPRDGTLVLLLIYPDEERCCPLEDTEKGSRTVGHNNFEHDGDDRWLFSGWSWEQDHYTQGDGNPAGWMPLPEAT